MPSMVGLNRQFIQIPFTKVMFTSMHSTELAYSMDSVSTLFEKERRRRRDTEELA